MTADELRQYNRIKQRESRERRGIGRKRRAPIVTPFVPFVPRVINGHCSVIIDMEELSQMPSTHIHAILEGVGKVIAAASQK